MRAAVQLGVAEPLLLAGVAVDAPGPREVLVGTAAAGVCHSDAFALEGRFPFPVPSVMGHESAGVVEAVGSEVTYVAPGDHVTTCLSVFTDTVDAGAGDVVEHVLELTGGGVEWSFEAVGSAATDEQAFGMLRAGGTCTVVGVLAGSTVRLDGITLNWDRRIQGSLMGSNRFRIDIPRYVDLYLQGPSAARR